MPSLRPRRQWTRRRDLGVFSIDADVGAKPGPLCVGGARHAEVANLGAQPDHTEARRATTQRQVALAGLWL